MATHCHCTCDDDRSSNNMTVPGAVGILLTCGLLDLDNL